MAKTTKSLSATGATAILLSCAGPAAAESLAVTGFYPANNLEASKVNSITVGPIQGSDGAALGYEIEAALGDALIDSKPWFRIISSNSGGAADAQLTGVANAGLDEQSFRETRNECVERDENDKCIRNEDSPMRCTRRIINLTVTLRLATRRDGQILYSVQKPQRDEVTYCPDRHASETPDEVVSRMISQIANSVRYDLAPHYSTDRVKVMERNKGMSKPVAQQFKAAVKTTKSNPDYACTLFSAINQQTAGLGPVIYDMALCAERDGKLDEAVKLYEEARSVMPGENLVYEGLKRIEARKTAQEVFEQRMRR